MKSILSIAFLLFANILFSQSFIPSIKNYSIEDYKADNQNWDIDVSNTGEVFVANNKGLLRFNGQSWELYEMPNKTILRSVFCDNDKIYTGSYEEFGFWKKNSFGKYVYTSLMNSFDSSKKVNNEQFWKILKFKDVIYFRSFARGIYTYNGKEIKYIENSQGVSNETIYENNLLLINRNQKIIKLEEGKLLSLNQNDYNLKDLEVVNLFADNNSLFYFTKKGKGYVLRNGKKTPLPKNLNLFLSKNILNKVSFYNRNKIAFGSIKKGIAIYDLLLNKTEYISKSDGLQNNTVLSFKNFLGNLWVALDNGIAQINVNTTMSFFKDNTGALGTVYDVEYFNNNYFLASNTGVYTFSKNNELTFIEGSEGQTWSLDVIEKDLIANHTNGSYIIKNNTFSQKLNDVGVFCTVNYKNIILQGTYYGVNYLKKTNGLWASKTVKNIPFLVDNIVFENEFTIWISHPHKGVYRVILNSDYSEAIKITSFGESKKLDQSKTEVFRINDEVIFSNGNKWFTFNKVKKKIEDYPNFIKGKNKNLIINKNEKWVIDREAQNSLILLNNKFEDSLQFNISSANERLVSKYEKVISKNDSIRILNLNDGFATFNIHKINFKQNNNLNPIVEKIYSPTNTFNTKNLNDLEIPYNDANFITIQTYLPFNYGANLEYILTGEINELNKVNNSKIILQNLKAGNYSLYLKTELGIDKTEKKLIDFKVLPPWYLSNFIKVLYLILLIIIVWLTYYYTNKRIKSQQLKLKKEYVKRTQERINKIEKENLKNEINSKKKELISSTASIIKRNEVILSLRNELRRLLEFSNNKIRTERLIKMSKEKIEDEKEWKVFENNFKKLHEDFFKKLIHKYPKLTTKDLKLCAYIKMGFSTKEIAPLMGITVRGVEIHRYRLRKKLNLDSNESIHNYLILFN
ncbi:LuxR C-terminal-related transcriptional regulator [Polaribacter aestuariivivens]|uniref:helix-turn-helix and ligand-binding sensor domain-containing protein n=1 Tax=Polaribacter aestuariivivens TaxID=2304626 RepID=UPI003F490E66